MEPTGNQCCMLNKLFRFLLNVASKRTRTTVERFDHNCLELDLDLLCIQRASFALQLNNGRLIRRTSKLQQLLMVVLKVRYIAHNISSSQSATWWPPLPSPDIYAATCHKQRRRYHHDGSSGWFFIGFSVRRHNTMRRQTRRPTS